MPDRPDFYKRVIQESTRERSVKEQTDKVFYDYAYNVVAGSGEDVKTWTIPSGKVLYITDVNFGGNGNGVWHVRSWKTGERFYMYNTDTRQATYAFSLPMRFSEGDKIIIHVTNPTANTNTYNYYVHGWLESI